MKPRRSLILDTTVRLVFDAAMVLSLYMLFAGHNQPGGGFVGGLVAAAALALRYIAGGLDQVRLPGDVQPWTLLSVGLALILVFIGVKMLLGVFDAFHIPPAMNLVIVLGLLAAGVIGSYIFPQKECPPPDPNE